MLAGATLLVFANKQDLPGALSSEEIRDVRVCLWPWNIYYELVNNLFRVLVCKFNSKSSNFPCFKKYLSSGTIWVFLFDAKGF
jgi:hypothetical protein